MKKISAILESQAHKRNVDRIESRDQFIRFVHETLSSTKGYSKTGANMIAESLLDSYPNNFKKAAEELANFHKGG